MHADCSEGSRRGGVALAGRMKANTLTALCSSLLLVLQPAHPPLQHQPHLLAAQRRNKDVCRLQKQVHLIYFNMGF